MGLNHSPRIVTSNLVLTYDMGNTDKSWKGAPTTNLAYALITTVGGWNSPGYWSQHPVGSGAVIQTTLADGTTGSVYASADLSHGLYGFNNSTYTALPNGPISISIWVKLYNSATGSLAIRNADSGGSFN